MDMEQKKLLKLQASRSLNEMGEQHIKDLGYDPNNVQYSQAGSFVEKSGSGNFTNYSRVEGNKMNSPQTITLNRPIPEEYEKYEETESYRIDIGGIFKVISYKGGTLDDSYTFSGTWEDVVTREKATLTQLVELKQAYHKAIVQLENVISRK